jgi:hypothetical protein
MKSDRFYTFITLLIGSVILAVKVNTAFVLAVILILFFLMVMTGWEMSMLEADKDFERKKRL